MTADDLIPMSVAAAVAWGRLMPPTLHPSPRELSEQLAVMSTILAAAIPASERVDGAVRGAALFEAVERLRREAAAQSSEIMPR